MTEKNLGTSRSVTLRARFQFGTRGAESTTNRRELDDLLQYRLKYRNADLGTSSKAPRFCLKHTLHQYRACPHGALG